MLSGLQRAQLEAKLLWEQLGFKTPSDDAHALETEELLRAHLLDQHVITSSRWKEALADEPHFYQHSVSIDSVGGNAGGTSLSRSRAMRTALAEAVERKIWLTETGHIGQSPRMPASQLPTNTPRASAYVLSDNTHAAHGEHVDELSLQWTSAFSYTRNRSSFVPSQLLSAAYARQSGEVLLRQPITTGLATAPTRLQSLLSGTLEVIERDAIMVTWLGGVSPVRIAHDSLTADSPDLKTFLKTCEQYSLTVDFVQLFSDAPTYTIMAVVRDGRMMPPIAVGASAGQDSGACALKALLEALRARQNSRGQRTKQPAEQNSRLLFWSQPDHATHAAFLTKGPITSLQKAPWHHESSRLHFKRLCSWARASAYDVLAANLSHGEANIPGWHIYQVVIPQLQPLHQDESQKSTYGTRIESVIRGCGHELTSINTVRHPFF
ncbi:MAG: YcaO-like family protein [Candidatus Pacebacteria bacterium]|nr:YcaO-like family protein [Candidatus Paceibacterota bacterium]